jgi:hypothetical protein
MIRLRLMPFEWRLARVIVGAVRVSANVACQKPKPVWCEKMQQYQLINMDGAPYGSAQALMNQRVSIPKPCRDA